MLEVKPYSLSYQGDGASHGHAVNGVDVGLGRIEHATVGVARGCRRTRCPPSL